MTRPIVWIGPYAWLGVHRLSIKQESWTQWTASAAPLSKPLQLFILAPHFLVNCLEGWSEDLVGMSAVWRSQGGCYLKTMLLRLNVNRRSLLRLLLQTFHFQTFVIIYDLTILLACFHLAYFLREKVALYKASYVCLQ